MTTEELFEMQDLIHKMGEISETHQMVLAIVFGDMVRTLNISNGEQPDELDAILDRNLHLAYGIILSDEVFEVISHQNKQTDSINEVNDIINPKK
jgi:glycerol-3-phosphate dehydrogenase